MPSTIERWMTSPIAVIVTPFHLMKWTGFVLIAEEPQPMANVFVVVAILAVFAKRVGRAHAICLVERTSDANQENR